MAAGNQAPDGKAQSAGYQLGELELDAKPPKRSVSGDQPVANTNGSLPPQRSQAQSLAKAYAAQAQQASRGAPASPSLPAGPGLGRPTSVDLGDESSDASGIELDLAPARTPRAAAPKSAAPAMDFNAFGGKELGDGFEDAPEEGPEIEVESVQRPRGDKAASAKEGGAKEPKTEVAKEDQLTRELADYGDTPTRLFACVHYAVHVVVRVIALKRDRVKAVQDAERLESELSGAFAEMGQALMAMASDPKLAGLRTQVAAVHDAHAEVSKADQTVSKTREQNQEVVATLDREAQQLLAALAPYLDAEKAAEAAHKKVDDELKRGQGLQRRVEIELRALNEAKIPPDPARVEQLQAQLEQRRDTVGGLTGAVEQAAQALGQARREVALRRGAVDSVEERKRRVIEAARAKEAQVAQHAKVAEGSHAAALRVLAEAAREQRLDKLVADRASKVKQSEGQLAEAHQLLARYDRALALYDRPSVIKGFSVALALIALAIVAIKLTG